MQRFTYQNTSCIYLSYLTLIQPIQNRLSLQTLNFKPETLNSNHAKHNESVI